jgi:hypothetical protein
LRRGGFLKKYILSIYRGEKDKPKSLVGVVEEVGVQGKKAFTNLDELWEILNPVKKGIKSLSSEAQDYENK